MVGLHCHAVQLGRRQAVFITKKTVNICVSIFKQTTSDICIIGVKYNRIRGFQRWTIRRSTLESPSTCWASVLRSEMAKRITITWNRILSTKEIHLALNYDFIYPNCTKIKGLRTHMIKRLLNLNSAVIICSSCMATQLCCNMCFLLRRNANLEGALYRN